MLLVAVAARIGLIFALNAQGRHVQAEELAREALGARHEADRFTLLLRLGLARSLNGQARHEAALAEAERADDLFRSLSEEERRSETGAVELAMATAWAWAAGTRLVPGLQPPTRLAWSASARTITTPLKPGRCSTA
nr:hypothetical protein OH826_18575 [Streptomyces sp. NBC_00899]